jgi:hypothetical protein
MVNVESRHIKIQKEDVGLLLIKIGAGWFLICLLIAMYTNLGAHEISVIAVVVGLMGLGLLIFGTLLDIFLDKFV